MIAILQLSRALCRSPEQCSGPCWERHQELHFSNPSAEAWKALGYQTPIYFFSHPAEIKRAPAMAEEENQVHQHLLRWKLEVSSSQSTRESFVPTEKTKTLLFLYQVNGDSKRNDQGVPTYQMPWSGYPGDVSFCVSVAFSTATLLNVLPSLDDVWDAHSHRWVQAAQRPSMGLTNTLLRCLGVSGGAQRLRARFRRVSWRYPHFAFCPGNLHNVKSWPKVPR